jgi:hypothetical protein
MLVLSGVFNTRILDTLDTIGAVVEMGVLSTLK